MSADAQALIDLPEPDVLALLGMQEERLNLARQRAEQGRAVPPWDDRDALARLTQAQRAPGDDIGRYLARGRDAAQGWLDDLQDGLRLSLCIEGAVKPELMSLEGDARELLKTVSPAVVALVAANLPAGVAAAAASIGTTLALLLIKRRLVAFCALPPATEPPPLTWPTLS
jgi:hypothetical protein